MKYTLETITRFIHSYIDEEPKPNIHVGETMSCWTYYAMQREAISMEEICLYTTTDKELLDIVKKTLEGANSQCQKLEDFMKKEGIPLPPVSEPKPKSKADDIPLGAKMTDNEIANFISMKVAVSTTYCATAFTECIRNDIAFMFLSFQIELMEFGTILKSVMRKRGWLKVPPDYHPPGKPNT